MWRKWGRKCAGKVEYVCKGSEMATWEKWKSSEVI